MAVASSDLPWSLPGREEEVGCYSGLYSKRAEVVAPRDVDELKQVFADAREQGRKVTLRAGGHCFDSQPVGGDVVVSMVRMNWIEPPHGERITVGAGARWRDILATLKGYGLVPVVTVTTENATAGGTLSGDCLSRFSPSWGKEGKYVESFDLLTVEGERITCNAPPEGASVSAWTPEQSAFWGVIGGLGYLGAVVSITYRVKRAAPPGGTINVRVKARRTDTVEELAKELMPKVQEALVEEADAGDEDKLDAIWSALDMRAKTKSAILFTAAFTNEKRGKRMLLHRPKFVLRPLVEWAMRWPRLCRLCWWYFVNVLFRKKREYVDQLEGYTFFMDGNARAKRIAKKWFKAKMQNCQQTFVVPGDPLTDAGLEIARRDLLAWLERAEELFCERGLAPTLTDVLYLPEDLQFALSANAGLPGFAVSYAFETSNAKRLQRIEHAFSDLADILWDDFDGRVYLIKNVFARPEILAQMYEQGLAELGALKAKLDPAGMLTSEFFDEKIPVAS